MPAGCDEDPQGDRGAVRRRGTPTQTPLWIRDRGRGKAETARRGGVSSGARRRAPQVNDLADPATHPTLAPDASRSNGGLARPRPVPPYAAHPDLLSDVLDAVRVERALLCVFEFGEPWAVELDYMPLAMTWTVTEGTFWLRPHGCDPIAFHAGDTILLPRGIVDRPYVISSSPDVAPARMKDFWKEAELQGFKLGSSSAHRHFVRWGGPGKTMRAASLAFGFADRTMSPLIAALPEVLFARAAEVREPLVDVTLNMLLFGKHGCGPGWEALVRQITQTLAVIVIRTHALSTVERASGWLAGLGDVHISCALASMHREPGRHWTLPTLARVAGLSRSVFAERFFARVGQTPKRYLRSWRMHLAREALAEGRIGVATLAHKLGYLSEAAFRKAFQEATGQPPLKFRRRIGVETIESVVEDVEQTFGLYARLARGEHD